MVTNVSSYNYNTGRYTENKKIRQCRLDLFDNIVEAVKTLHEVLALSEAQLSFIDEEFGLFIFWVYEIKIF